MPVGSAPNLLNKSWSVTANVEIPDGSVEGVVWAMGALEGGFTLYFEDGQPTFAGNFLGRTISRATSAQSLPEGHAVLRGEFAYDGGGMGRGATLSLFVNDQKVGEARMEQTQPITLGIGATLDFGLDTGSPADDIYEPPFPFTGEIESVTIQLEPAGS